MPETRKYTVVDLFAGVGGLSYGFSQSDRFEIILANEMLKDIAKAWIKECLGTGFADVLYNLRCDIVHAGCANIADGGKRLFFSLDNHCSGLSFEQFRIIDVKQLCECLIGHAKSWCATSNMACIKNTYIFNSRDRDDKLLYDKLCADERAKQLKAEFEKELMSSE